MTYVAKLVKYGWFDLAYLGYKSDCSQEDTMIAVREEVFCLVNEMLCKVRNLFYDAQGTQSGLGSVFISRRMQKRVLAHLFPYISIARTKKLFDFISKVA